MTFKDVVKITDDFLYKFYKVFFGIYIGFNILGKNRKHIY